MPFANLQDVRLYMKRSEVEKRHNLQPDGNGYLASVSGYPVHFDFIDDRLVSMRMWEADASEPASRDRFRIYVQQTYRETGIKPVCGFEAATTRNAARFDFNGGSLLIIHEAELTNPGEPNRRPTVIRWMTVDPSDFWKTYAPQVCVR